MNANTVHTYEVTMILKKINDDYWYSYNDSDYDAYNASTVMMIFYYNNDAFGVYYSNDFGDYNNDAFGDDNTVVMNLEMITVMTLAIITVMTLVMILMMNLGMNIMLTSSDTK